MPGAPLSDPCGLRASKASPSINARDLDKSLRSEEEIRVRIRTAKFRT